MKSERKWVQPSEALHFLIFLQKVFLKTHKPPISDFGGRRPSPDVLKQKSQNDLTTAKLLGTLLKESERF